MIGIYFVLRYKSLTQEKVSDFYQNKNGHVRSNRHGKYEYLYLNGKLIICDIIRGVLLSGSMKLVMQLYTEITLVM